MSDEQKKPYRVWSIEAPFRSDGSPVVGTFGKSIRPVVIMESDTFKRLVKEHSSLATAHFEVGSFEP